MKMDPRFRRGDEGSHSRASGNPSCMQSGEPEAHDIFAQDDIFTLTRAGEVLRRRFSNLDFRVSNSGFVPQGFDGIEVRGFVRRVISEENSDAGGEQYGDHDGLEREREWAIEGYSR